MLVELPRLGLQKLTTRKNTKHIVIRFINLTQNQVEHKHPHPEGDTRRIVDRMERRNAGRRSWIRPRNKKKKTEGNTAEDG
jgi:hypothetical protein